MIGAAIRVVLLSVFLCLTAAPLWAQDDDDRGLVVLGLKFEGNKAIDDYSLRASIATSQSAAFARHWYLRWMGLGQKRYLNETEFRRDVLRILFLYRRSGFPEAQVDTVVNRSIDAVRIVFRITEGEPVLVDSLRVAGVAEILPGRELERDLPLEVGDRFDRQLFLASADSIRRILQNESYPFVEVYRGFDMNVETRKAQVEYEVVPGPSAVVGAVEVVGSNRIDESLVRRILGVRPGQRFSLEALYESQRQLYRLGVFDYVNVSLADSVYEGQQDSLVTVRAQVSEARLRRFRVGLGYGSFDCFRILTSWTVQNFLGGGRTLDLTGRLSRIGAGGPLDFGFDSQRGICWRLRDDAGTVRDTLNFELRASLRFPYVFSPRTNLFLSAHVQRRSEFQAYLRSDIGASAAITRQTPWNIPVTVSYAWERGITVASPGVFCSLFRICNLEDIIAVADTSLVQATLGFTVQRDRLNTPLNPSRGNILTAQVRHAGDGIGSDSLIQFTKLVLEFASYHPITRSSVFAWRLRFGVIDSPRLGGVERGVQSIPTQERFYAGGPSTVRGFSQNELGPVVYVAVPLQPSGELPDTLPADTIVSPTGGNQMFLANAEFRFRFPGFARGIGGVLFVDAGQVFERGDTVLTATTLKVTPGAGIRFFTPVGPVRLDIAYNPYPRQQGELYELQGDDLVLVSEAYPMDPDPPSGFFNRLRFNLSIGQAF